MKCCDTCKYFVLIPSQPNRVGFCNVILPQWLENIETMLGRHASVVKAIDGEECETWEDAS